VTEPAVEAVAETETYFVFTRPARRRGGREPLADTKPEGGGRARAKPPREGRAKGKAKPSRSEDRPERAEFKARPPRPEKPIDPDNPFAALLALKTRG
jgi:ATP-dependent RNA helicase SUPV3L1/SUV3